MWGLLVKEFKWKCAMALTRLSAAQARVLCLHYYSNALTFNFAEDPNEVTYHLNLHDSMIFVFCFKEVYREDKIKEWDPVDPSELEHFLQIILIPGKILPWCNQSPISPKSKIVHLHSTYHALFAKMSFFVRRGWETSVCEIFQISSELRPDTNVGQAGRVRHRAPR